MINHSNFSITDLIRLLHMALVGTLSVRFSGRQHPRPLVKAQAFCLSKAHARFFVQRKHRHQALQIAAYGGDAVGGVAATKNIEGARRQVGAYYLGVLAGQHAGDTFVVGVGVGAQTEPVLPLQIRDGQTARLKDANGRQPLAYAGHGLILA